MDNDSNNKLSSDVKFKKTKTPEYKTIGTQMGEKKSEDWTMVQDSLYDLFDNVNEFVVLTVPNADYNIRYVQAAVIPDSGVNVQLGIEEDDYTRLVEDIFSEEECISIFKKFYDSSYVDNVEKYTPVQFYV